MSINLHKKNIENIVIAVLLIVAFSLLGILTYLTNKSSIVSSNPTSVSGSGGKLAQIQNCYSDQNGVQKCMDKFMDEYMSSKTTRETLADLEVARSENTEIENNCHPIAHAIGRNTYKAKGNIGDAFEACDQTCHSGCYHGVMERLFYGDTQTDETKHLTYEDMKEKIPGICSKDKFANPTNAVIFQCLHGVGHAILFSLDYDLEDSLRSCDLFETQYEKSSCYGGVIMENVTAFDKKKRDIKQNEPLYPCSKLDDKYKNDCYMMQTSIMYEQGLSDEQISKECLKTNGFDSKCFISLGRDLSNSVRINDIPRVVKACEELSSSHSRDCLDGAIYALIDNTWDPRYAYKLCNSLKYYNNIVNCYNDSNKYLGWSYAKSEGDIKAYCSQYAESNTDICNNSL